MQTIIDEFVAWLNERPLVIQEATQRIMRKEALEEEDYIDLMRICAAEVGMKFDDIIPSPVIPITSSTISINSHSHKVELKSISNIVGVNALNPKKPLVLVDGLNVIYGHNGSGKSGYTRLLKKICGAKNQGELLSNVFQAKASAQSCSIEYTFDDQNKALEWSSFHEINEHLSAIGLYDTSCAAVYVTDENQLAYEPPLLGLLSNIIFVCDKLAARFDEINNSLLSTKQTLPPAYINTGYGKWYNSISFKTMEIDVDGKCNWSEDKQNELNLLNSRLILPDAKAEADKIRKVRVQVNKLIAGFNSWKSKLSAESALKHIDVRRDYKVKQLAATKHASSVFENSPLTGVGEEVWALLWEKAKEYSTNVAYPDKTFPNLDEDAVCVLCQQYLSGDAKVRLSSFEVFINGELENLAKAAKKVLQESESALSSLPTLEIIESLVAAAGLSDDMSQRVFILRSHIVSKAEEVINAECNEDIKINVDYSVIDDLTSLSQKMIEAAEQLDIDAQKDGRNLLQAEAYEFEARKWIAEQKENIKSEISISQSKELIRKAKSDLSTTAITRKKSLLAEDLISSEYIKRFDRELAMLGAMKIKARLEKTRSIKGRIYFKIKLNDNVQQASIDRVLSEGEFRIISLAAFLADVEGHADKSTFIFDDPISSLDQDFEERVAERLVELSKSRQVLVFTHRLSLMALLDESNKKHGISPNMIGLYKEPWGTGEPGMPPVNVQKPKAAINTFIAKIIDGRRILDTQGSEEYSWWAKSLCSNIRITIEKVVEIDLLADVVQRFRRPVQTQGKLINVARVTEDDCNYIDSLMTKYSKYEHSQPDDATVSLPMPDEFEHDLIGLRSWRERFTGS